MKLKVAHLISNLRVAGAQVFTLELASALNRYCPDTENYIVLPERAKYDSDLLSSYPVPVLFSADISAFCRDYEIDVLIQHRLNTCLPVRKLTCPYVVVNHTLDKRTIPSADLHIAVSPTIQETVKDSVLILNGLENDYISALPSVSLAGEFKTGRCHRYCTGKFMSDSLTFLNSLNISNHVHHMIGEYQNNTPNVVCHGLITDRQKKMSLIKALSVYYYETKMQEGASIAVLESLACGVPVLCGPQGASLLVRDGVNGYICSSRKEYRERLTTLSSDPALLSSLRQSTLHDFETRLHIRHACRSYYDLLNSCVGVIPSRTS